MNGTPQYKVLIVDDDAMIRNLICTILSAKGHACEEASDGLKALERGSQRQYDAAIIDVVMPNMDGITLTRELLKRFPEMPIMLMSGYGRVSYKKQLIDEESLQAGASEFVDKPFSVNEFYIRFHKMMIHHQTLSQMRTRLQEIERRSSQLISELQKETFEKSESLKKECEDLRNKLNERLKEENKPEPECEAKEKAEELQRQRMIGRLKRRLNVIQEWKQ